MTGLNATLVRMKTRPDPIEGAEEDFPGKTVLGMENEGCVSRDEVVGRPNSQRAGNGKHKGTRGGQGRGAVKVPEDTQGLADSGMRWGRESQEGRRL